MFKPTEIHWIAVKRLLRYLKGTIHHGLTFLKHFHLNLIVYCDVDWALSPDDRKSTGVYCIFLATI